MKLRYQSVIKIRPIESTSFQQAVLIKALQIQIEAFSFSDTARCIDYVPVVEQQCPLCNVGTKAPSIVIYHPY